jgi:hypothetical protein
MDGQGLIHCEEKRLFSSLASRQKMGPTKAPIQHVPGALSQGVKSLGREADHYPAPSVGVNNEELITSSPDMSLWHDA